MNVSEKTKRFYTFPLFTKLEDVFRLKHRIPFECIFDCYLYDCYMLNKRKNMKTEVHTYANRLNDSIC